MKTSYNKNSSGNSADVRNPLFCCYADVTVDIIDKIILAFE